MPSFPLIGNTQSSLLHTFRIHFNGIVLNAYRKYLSMIAKAIALWRSVYSCIDDFCQAATVEPAAMRIKQQFNTSCFRIRHQKKGGSQHFFPVQHLTVLLCVNVGIFPMDGIKEPCGQPENHKCCHNDQKHLMDLFHTRTPFGFIIKKQPVFRNRGLGKFTKIQQMGHSFFF